MKKADFGQLVKTLRKKTSDEHGNSWTRESLSKYLHLSIDQLGRLERGDRKYLDSETLRLLAEAFNLSPIERKEFLIAAAGINDEDYCNHLSPEEQLEELIEITGNSLTPAFLLDAYQDVVAINKSCLELIMATEEVIGYATDVPFGSNLLKQLYDETFGLSDLFGPIWQNIAMVQIQQFRRTSFRFQHSDYYQQLFNELVKKPKFDINWYASLREPIDKYMQYELFSYIHPQYGPLNYIATEANTDTVYGELQLILYTPTDTTTAAIFYQLVSSEPQKVIRLADWPIK